MMKETKTIVILFLFNVQLKYNYERLGKMDKLVNVVLQARNFQFSTPMHGIIYFAQSER